MKIVLMTYGSRGDVQPMIALTLALHSAGHDALLAGPPEKSNWAVRLGCPYAPLGGDLTAFIDTMEGVHKPGDGIRSAQRLRYEVKEQFRVIPEIIAGADRVVGSGLIFALSSLAEAARVSYRYIAFTPQILPSAHHPFPAFWLQGMPGWWNRAGWRLAGFLDRFNLTALVNRYRRRSGMAPLKNLWAHILGHTVLVASDRAIAQVPPDVTQKTVQTGYLHLDQPQKELPALERFLAAGPPPVYCGFGSMPKRDQIRNLPRIVSALRRAGQRMVLARFWDDPVPVDPAADLFFIQKYPHRHLFPRMAAVIHHGGAGTTATAAISGVPQIVVPHVLDQFYWGHRIHRSRLGPASIPRIRLTTGNLTAAVDRCLSDHRYRHHARRMAEAIQRENSLANMVAAVTAVDV